MTDRVALLMHHYRMLMGRITPAGIAALVAGSRIELIRLAGREDNVGFSIWLSRKKNFAVQGELSISFDDDQLPRTLATLAVNIYVDEQGAVIFYISGLQGPPRPFGKPEIVRATRSLSGLRPKRAVMEVALILARWFQADVIVAVGRSNHVTATGGRRGRNIRAEYDEFWLELGGICGPDGDYRLPANGRVALPRMYLRSIARSGGGASSTSMPSRSRPWLSSPPSTRIVPRYHPRNIRRPSSAGRRPPRRSAPPLEELNGALMLLGRLQRREGAQIAPPAGLRVPLARQQAVFAGLELADHGRRSGECGGACVSSPGLATTGTGRAPPCRSLWSSRRARLTRLLIVPTAQPLARAASS